ncbi:hypothetical protein FACS1894198_0950 [Clostridia bacterium]|nr:hypothetical protein FACS1894198_0950 [Clostridia bacterium]
MKTKKNLALLLCVAMLASMSLQTATVFAGRKWVPNTNGSGGRWIECDDNDPQEEKNILHRKAAAIAALPLMAGESKQPELSQQAQEERRQAPEREERNVCSIPAVLFHKRGQKRGLY